MAVVLVAVVVAGCGNGGDTAGTKSPEDVTLEFVQASLDKDASAMHELLTESDRQKVTVEELQQLVDHMPSGIQYEILNTSTTSSNEATVLVEFITDDEPPVAPYDLVKEDGE